MSSPIDTAIANELIALLTLAERVSQAHDALPPLPGTPDAPVDWAEVVGSVKRLRVAVFDLGRYAQEELLPMLNGIIRVAEAQLDEIATLERTVKR